MATREENLKKINAELELLSDEELEQVAGGTANETMDDSFLLYKLGLCDHIFYDGITKANSPVHSYYESSTIAEWEVKAAWKKAGVGFVPSEDGNKYFLNGEEISRDDAIKHVKANFTLARPTPGW